MEIVITLIFIVALLLSSVCSHLETNKKCKEQRMNTVAIYKLYEEVKRYNDNAFCKKRP